MPDRTRIIVIGGGIVGCSVLYSLAKLGWTDSVLIEKRNLTSGSTWHAAGNCTFFGHYPSITRLFVNSVNSYLQAESESSQSIDFHSTGSLRLATTKAELAFYHSLKPLYDQLGVSYEVVSPTTVSELFPILSTEGVLGAAHTPGDGHVDAFGATHALAKSAKLRGAEILLNHEVRNLELTRNGYWVVRTEDGDIAAEHVVVATSFWARELVQSLGLNVPVFALEHHEIVTDKVDSLQEVDFELPSIRDPYVPCNIRQEGNGLLCGIYESQPVPWATEGIPPEFAEDLLPTNISILESHMEKLVKRIPVFEQLGIKTVFNGPICYTPDGLPLLGPVNQLPGLWLATGFAIGIGTGGGSGEFLANWIVNGHPPYDLPFVHPSRFSNDLPKDDAIDKIIKTYARGYSIDEF